MSPAEPNALVTIATFVSAAQAHLVRMKLEAEGIQAFILDENTARIQSFSAPALGGIRVQVATEVESQARRILQEATGRDILPIEEEQETLKKHQPVCPSCGSSKGTWLPFSRATLLFSLLFLGLPFLFLPWVRECQNCGHKWKARK